MDLGVMVNIYEETEFTGAFEDAVEAGFHHGQVNVFLPRITPEEVRLLALAARAAGFTVDAVGCYCNPLRPDDAGLNQVDYLDFKTVAANMCMMNGVERVVCWSGTLGKTLTTPNLLNQEEETFTATIAALRAMLDDLKGLNVQILVEPFTAHVLCDGKTCSRFVQKFPGGEIKIALDAPNVIPHKEFAHRDQRVREFVTEVAPYVGLIHLKDMAHDDNGHRRFPRAGAGVLDYAAYLRTIVEKAPAVPLIIDHVYSLREMIAARQFVEAVVRDSGL